MNKPNGIKDQTSLSTKEHKSSRHSSSALPTFLKWFKKSDRENKSSSSSSSIHHHKINGNISSSLDSSHETLNSTQSNIFGKISPSSSCDSVLSTSTTGFAYIKPNNYKPEGIIKQKKLIVESGPETDTQRRRRMKNCNGEYKNLTLRTKYRLYNADTDVDTDANTLKSNVEYCLEYDNAKCFDGSLPNVKNKLMNERKFSNRIGRHRRTVSDSSKEKKSGAYVHVKGKGRAPPPPSSSLVFSVENRNSSSRISNHFNNNTNDSIIRTSSPASTLSKKKKRKAPYPPTLSPLFSSSSSKSASDGDDLKLMLSDRFFSDKDIKAILENTNFSTNNNKMENNSSTNIMTSSTAFENVNHTSKLTDTQKQKVIEKVVEAQSIKTNNENNVVTTTTSNNDSKPQNSPISPRPWYKRPISSNRESSIPFKREVVLKTMEKRKQKHKEKTESSKSGPFSDVGYSRSSIFDAGHKFGFFLRHKDHQNDGKSKDKEKRRSGIGIPNISELDREAAAILNEEHAKARDELLFKASSEQQVILQQQMFTSRTNDNNIETKKSDSENIEMTNSAKDLISKFDSDSDVSKILVNTSFIGRPELFLGDKNKTNSPTDSSVKADSTKIAENSTNPVITNLITKENGERMNNGNVSQALSSSVFSKEKNNSSSTKTKEEINCMSKLSWTCPTCTLENPSWRIMCEVCERLKPFEKFVTNKNKIEQTAKLIEENNKQPKNLENNSGWDEKTEKVMKYFKPRAESNNALSKSSSESTVGKRQLFIKSSSPSKLPIGSPKLSNRNRSHKNEDASVKTKISNMKELDNIPEKPKNSFESNIFPLSPDDEIKQPLLDSSVVVATITPVFYASKNMNVMNESPKDTKIETINNDQKVIDLKEIRNARLLKFSPSKPTDNISNIILSSSSKEELLKDPNFLEMEKKRLREKIRAMNAKALSEKYPVHELRAQNDNNRGAVKKTIKQNLLQANLETTNDYFARPKKVSASVQTPAFVKKDIEVDEIQAINNVSTEAIYNSPKIVNKKFNQKAPQELNKENNVDPINQTKSENKLIEMKTQRILEKSLSNEMNDIISNDPVINLPFNPRKEINRTDTIALNKIMKSLELAIADGDDELAARIAMDLAKMKVSLQVTKTNRNRNKLHTTVEKLDDQKIITTNVLVEDNESFLKKLRPLEIKPEMTIAELKQKAFNDFSIPVEAQRWLINSTPANDDLKTLQQYNVVDNSAHLFLKKTSTITNNNEKKIKLIPTKAVCEEIDEFSDGNSSDEATGLSNNYGAAALPVKSSKIWQCPLCTLINAIDCETCSACTKARPQRFTKNENDFVSKITPYTNNESATVASAAVLLKQPENKNDLNKSNSNRKSAEILNIVNETITKAIIGQINNNFAALHFSSPNITKYKYRGVDNFNPNRKSFDQEIPIVKEEIEIKVKHVEKEPQKTVAAAPIKPDTTKNHYLELLNLENSDVVLNIDVFECPICFTKFEPGEGVILRDCLHTFCKECLSSTVQHSDEAEVKCPYIDAEYSCTSVLQEREIKAIVTKDIYELHLAKSVRVAEHQIENTFHCKTPNCRGWCIYEDNVNQFKCPVCRITNCLTCRVIHDGLTCKQYQDRLNSDCDSNIEARRTKEMLAEMVEKGEAMNCPTCQVILMKKWGCDWLKCSMCKTEVCWVTRGPRWGPGGKGDTSAGCKCGVDGKKCHPKCNYCH